VLDDAADLHLDGKPAIAVTAEVVRVMWRSADGELVMIELDPTRPLEGEPRPPPDAGPPVVDAAPPSDARPPPVGAAPRAEGGPPPRDARVSAPADWAVAVGMDGAPVVPPSVSPPGPDSRPAPPGAAEIGGANAVKGTGGCGVAAGSSTPPGPVALVGLLIGLMAGPLRLRAVEP